MERQLVASYVRCRACGTILQSTYRHDYKTCSCDNETMIDGGLSYDRYGGMDLSLIERIAVFSDEDFVKVRQHMYRGGYGKDGTEKFKLTRLFEMTDGHLNALLTYPCPEWQRDLVKKEIEYRKENNIKI